MKHSEISSVGLHSSPFNSSFKGQLEKGKGRLNPYLPRFNNWRFWVVQVIIIAVAAIHDGLEITGFLPHLGELYFFPISIFFVPVVYSALNFGFKGSLATVIWIVILTIPNWVLWHHGLARVGVIFQMFLLVGIAIFVGHKVDKEAAARHKAETASAELKTYAAHIVNVQEEEHRRIARELHDQTIQMVVFLGRQLEDLSNHEALASPVTKQLQSARDVNQRIANNLRDFAQDLRPPTLDDLGLVDSISKLLLDFSDRTSIESYLKLVGEEKRLYPDTEVGLFRILQEALRNIERHSKATKAIVTMIFTLDEAEVNIEDNGTGFDVVSFKENRAMGNHFGIVGMQERAELSGGKLNIQSVPQKGTTITISVPICQ